MKTLSFVALMGLLFMLPLPQNALADDDKDDEFEIFDDFEEETLDSFPSQWLDGGRLDPTPNTPDPSAIVGKTTNAFGKQTNALTIVEAFAYSQGIYQLIPGEPSLVSMSVDVRVDKFSSGPGTNDWDNAIVMMVSLLADVDSEWTPTMGIYINNETESWWWAAYGPDCGWRDYPLGLLVELGTWYRVQLNLDTVKGVIKTKITDIKKDRVLLYNYVDIPDWKPECMAFFDAVSFVESEYNSTYDANVTVIDNVYVSVSDEFDDNGEDDD